MTPPEGPAAPASGNFDDDTPSFEELAADPEIAALLDFEPVPRKGSQVRAWTAELQREFIARLAVHGSITKGAAEVRKDRSGVLKVYNSLQGASFRAAWHDAIDLARRRAAEQVPDGPPPAAVPPTIGHRKHAASRRPFGGQGGEAQVLNEYGEPEDEESYYRRAEEARDSISGKMQRCRRLFLASIAGHPAKRAAFEILNEYPIDWDKAERCEPQPDQPWRKPNMRNPDMILTAENGWLGGFVHGPDRKAELLADLNLWRASQGMPPIGDA